MDASGMIIALAAFLIAFWFARYIWLMTHRVAVRIDGKAPHFSKLEPVIDFIERELRKAQGDRNRLTAFAKDDGFLEIEISVQGGAIVHDFIFTGPLGMISSLAKEVRSTETYREMSGHIYV